MPCPQGRRSQGRTILRQPPRQSGASVMTTVLRAEGDVDLGRRVLHTAAPHITVTALSVSATSAGPDGARVGHLPEGRVDLDRLARPAGVHDLPVADVHR